MAWLSKFALRIAVIGSGSLLMSGVAMAETTATVETTETQAVVTVESVTMVEEHSSSQVVMTSTGESPGVVTTEPTLTQTEESAPVDPAGPVSDVVAIEPAMTSAPVSEPVADRSQVAPIVRVVASVLPLRGYQPVAESAVVALSAMTSPPGTSATPTPGSVPLQPIGAVGAWLTLLAQVVAPRLMDGNIPLAVLLLAAYAAAALTTVSGILRRSEISFGAWLKANGYLLQRRLGIRPFSIYATPTVMSYAAAPAPYA